VRDCKGVCSVVFSPADTRVQAQTPGDCQELICDGAGEIVQVADDGDQPNDDNDCTNNACMDGVPVFPPLPEGTECNGQSTCNAVGICIECALPEECDGEDDFCKARTCIADQCGFDFTPAGTPIPMQVAGDCRQDVCDGTGNVVNQNADTDVSNDMNVCTADTCNNGTPVHTPTPGVSCGTGKMCDDQGNCV